MKKIIFTIFVILILIIIILVSLFYFQKTKNISAQAVVNVENRSPIKSNLAAPSPKDNDLEAGLPSKPSSKIKILFLGDMMFDRYIRQVAEKHGYNFLFQGTDNLLKGNDLVVGNLEGPITDNQSKSVNTEFGSRENYIFTFDPQTADTLKNHNINLVDIGNNHILNFKEEGREQTKEYLDKSGIDYFCADGSRIKTYKLNGLNVGFVCYNQFESDAENKTLNDIVEAKGQNDILILYTHWGKEYETVPLEKTKILAHKFIDAGVDLIIGSHSHVVQIKEIYQGKIIYYSLGNFIFDQYFDLNSTRGLAIKVIINPENKNLSFEEYPLALKNNGQTQLEK
jgi:gamma-polyglutamate biosynthesis protein CapA